MCADGCIGLRFRCLCVSSFCLFVIPASESSQKNEEELYLLCAAGCIGLRFRCLCVSSFCLLCQHQKVHKRMRKNSIVCTPGCIGFRFRCLCVSSPSNFSAKVLRQKAAARRHKLTLQKSNTLIWTFLSLCKELQSLCWSSGKQSCSRSGENYCDGTDHRLRQPQETHLANPFVRIYLETCICSDHILSHYISTLLPQQCIVGKFNSRCYPC